MAGVGRILTPIVSGCLAIRTTGSPRLATRTGSYELGQGSKVAATTGQAGTTATVVSGVAPGGTRRDVAIAVVEAALTTRRTIRALCS